MSIPTVRTSLFLVHCNILVIYIFIVFCVAKIKENYTVFSILEQVCLCGKYTTVVGKYSTVGNPELSTTILRDHHRLHKEHISKQQ